jgi:hypothetical protein
VQVTVAAEADVGARSVTLTTGSGSFTTNSVLTVTFPNTNVPSTPPLRISDVEDGAIRSGYAIVTPDPNSSVPVASITFGLLRGGVVQSQAGVLPAPLTTDASTFVETIAGIGRDLGLAIVNPGDESNAVALTLRDEFGRTVASTTTEVPRRFHLAQFVREWFAQSNLSASFRGNLRMQSTLPFAVLGLRFSGAEFSTVGISGTAVTSIPTRTLSAGSTTDTPRAGTVGGASAILFPQFAMSGGWASQISLVNSRSATITGRVDIFDDAGNPLPVRLNGLLRSTFTYSIPAGGSFVLAPRDANGQSPM